MGYFVLSVVTDLLELRWLFVPKYLTMYAAFLDISQETYPENYMVHSTLTGLSLGFTFSSDM